ncbi:MAG: hypothetical protein KC503_00460 [Myxococcales bacterium]|nr:hypothetical protein [Myxococcales bacterium]
MRWIRWPATLLLAATAATACGSGDGASSNNTGGGGKSDTAWVSSTTYEIDGELTSTIVRAASGRYEDLATNAKLQLELIDDQLKFAKNSMKAHGYHVNQLAQSAEVLSAEQNDGVVTLRYRAQIDMVAETHGRAPKTSIDQIAEREFLIPLPLDPIDVYGRAGEDCAKDWSPYALADYKYYYYFAPDKTNADGEPICKIEMQQGQIKLLRVHVQKPAWPEYDQLLGDRGAGKKGFRAAVLAGEAHDTLVNVMESRLGLEPTELERGVKRYTLAGDGVEIEIDLYPGAYRFHEVLGEYQLVFYHGHSSYGTTDYLTEVSAYRSDYQIISMNSCRNYSYYARQVFRAKAQLSPDSDPTGWKTSDFLANVESGWVSYSARTFEPLIRRLLTGIEAVNAGRDADAPDWLSIVKAMDAMDRGVLYGAAGVRDNAWSPPRP